jgi:hypothetical protein
MPAKCQLHSMQSHHQLQVAELIYSTRPSSQFYHGLHHDHKREFFKVSRIKLKPLDLHVVIKPSYTAQTSIIKV